MFGKMLGTSSERVENGYGSAGLIRDDHNTLVCIAWEFGQSILRISMEALYGGMCVLGPCSLAKCA